VSAGDDVVEFESVPFYCSQCLSTDRQQTGSSQDPTQCYHCHSQRGSRKKKTIRCSQCDRPFHLSCVKISRKHANKLPGWYCNTCDPVLKPPHPRKTPIMSTPLIDPASFGAYTQSLQSTTLSTASPRQHALLLPQDLANSLAKPSLQTPI